jgi:hypothetical protein
MGWMISLNIKRSIRYRVQLWRDRIEELRRWFFPAVVLVAVAFAIYAIGVYLVQNL